MNRYQGVDFVRLYQILALRAMRIVRHYGGHDTFDAGFDYEDVFNEVLTAFLDSPDGLGWKENKGALHSFLGQILHNKIVDHLRREKHVGDPVDDDNRISAKARIETPERAKTDFTARLYELVGDDAALRDLIAAAEMTSGGPNVNQEMGDIMGKTPHQVSKLKDRLLKKEGVRELYAARKAAKTRA